MEKLITVITPSYNTPLDLFKNAFDSMMAQQLAKDKIEWIIVVHNSSPRNHGLGFATGKYMTFLDADDALAPSRWS